MDIFNKIKQLFDKGSKELVKTGEELSEKAETMSKEGVEFAKEKISELGDTATDITNMIRYKMDASSKEKELNLIYQELGELSFILKKTDKWEKYNDSFDQMINEIYNVRQYIDEKDSAYQELRKRYSNNYEVKKLTEDLGQGDAVISQAVISKDSKMAGKLIKENLLPKEALISVVKRGQEVIIPDGNTKLYAGDELTIIGKPNDVEKVTKRVMAV